MLGPSSHRRSRLGIRTCLVIAGLLSLGLLHLGCGAPKSSAGPRVILVGIDGLDWKVMEPLMTRGVLPNLARLRSQGMAGRLSTLLPTYSPIIWASIATGKNARQHGITGFVNRRPSGETTPFTSNSRRSRALWNILSDADRRVAVVGWWTTWPAERVNGVMVSDRMLYNRFNLWLGLAHHGEDLPAQTYPESLFDTLVEKTRIPETLEQEFFETFGPELEQPVLERNLHDPWYELFLVFARDRAYVDILEIVHGRERFDFTAFYLNGADIASHYFWKYRFPEDWEGTVPEATRRERERVIERYYRWVDRAIAPLLAQVGEDCVVVVVSDHGFVGGKRSDSPEISGIHYNVAPPGVILMAGGGLPSGTTLHDASVLDITPTLLHLMGFAVGRDMDGRVLAEVRDAPALDGREVAFVSTFEPVGSGGEVDPLVTGHDDAILERLRALGYID
ncbi:MAG: alkaline phosphatase family protein [Acidobacteria bacterium]|nr:alkaline phosphatase family protein [Acidobacteriota bacterium]